MVGSKIRSSEQGFSIIEFSLVFVVIVLIATAAGIVANRQDGATASLKPNVLQLGTQPSTRSSSPTTTTLELSSLGIDITVPNAINDLTYAAPNTNGGYGISTKTLTSDDPNCVATGSEPPLGYFFKGTGQYPGSSQVPDRLVKQFGAFYIAWSAATTACSANSTVTTLASQDSQDLTRSFDTIEEMPPSAT